MKKLVIIGDSVIKGVYCAPDTGKYKLIEDCNFLGSFGDKIPVENKAVIGATLSKCEKILYKIDKDRLSGNGVLFSFGGNDSNFCWKDISENPEGCHLPSTTEKDLIEGYEKMISYVKSLGCRVFMTNLVPIDPHKFFDTISSGLSSDNILKWLGDKDMLYRWHEYYNGVIEKISKNTGVALADIRSPFITSRNYKTLLSSDGIHPSVEGHAIIHDTVSHSISRLLS